MTKHNVADLVIVLKTLPTGMHMQRAVRRRAVDARLSVTKAGFVTNATATGVGVGTFNSQ